MIPKRTIAVVTSVLLLSTAVFVGGLVFSPMFGDKNMEGDWYLTWAAGRSSDGADVSDVFAPYSLLRISVSPGGSVCGSMDGADFTGASEDGMIRFSLALMGGTAQMMGILRTPNALNIVAVVHGGGSYGSYSLLFTKDSVLPHMIEEIQTHITGDWMTGHIGGSGGVTDIRMNVAGQNSSIAYGTMDKDGTETGFCLAVSMVKNETMNAGLLVTEDGTFWTISVKKGLMIMHTASVSGGDVVDVYAYLVRDPGNIFVPVPVSFNTGDVWKGRTGYDPLGESDISAYTLSITDQTDGIIYGNITGGAGCVFVGVFFASEPAAAELTLLIGGNEVLATMFVSGNTMHVAAFGGSLFDDMVSMVFMK